LCITKAIKNKEIIIFIIVKAQNPTIKDIVPFTKAISFCIGFVSAIFFVLSQWFLEKPLLHSVDKTLSLNLAQHCIVNIAFSILI